MIIIVRYNRRPFCLFLTNSIESIGKETCKLMSFDHSGEILKNDRSSSFQHNINIKTNRNEIEFSKRLNSTVFHFFLDISHYFITLSHLFVNLKCEKMVSVVNDCFSDVLQCDLLDCPIIFLFCVIINKNIEKEFEHVGINIHKYFSFFSMRKFDSRSAQTNVCRENKIVYTLYSFYTVFKKKRKKTQ